MFGIGKSLGLIVITTIVLAFLNIGRRFIAGKYIPKFTMYIYISKNEFPNIILLEALYSPQYQIKTIALL